MFDSFLAERTARRGRTISPFDIGATTSATWTASRDSTACAASSPSRGIELPEGDSRRSPERRRSTGWGAEERDLPRPAGAGGVRGRSTTPSSRSERWRPSGAPHRADHLQPQRPPHPREFGGPGGSLFEVVVDGNDAERLGIAASRLPTSSSTPRGSSASSRGRRSWWRTRSRAWRPGGRAGFGLVVGVARNGGEGLREAGADLVVATCARWTVRAETSRDGSRPERPHALEQITIDAWAIGAGPLLRLRRDAHAHRAPAGGGDALGEMRSLLRGLASRCDGGHRQRARSLRRAPDGGAGRLYYAGSHGFDVAGPDGLRMQQEEARAHLPDLDAAERS
jgi:hypothetical protein